MFCSPLELGEQEVSVYDIKDHPDFKYRPASCVIRVANFEVGLVLWLPASVLFFNA